MDTPFPKFRVPRKLPLELKGWTRSVNARWHRDLEEVAAIYKMIDDEGYVTPITHQYDRRVPPAFQSGYGILNTGLVFPTWHAVLEYWPKYVAQLEEEGSEAPA